MRKRMRRFAVLGIVLFGSVNGFSQTPTLQAVHAIGDPGLDSIDVYITFFGFVVANIQDIGFRTAVPQTEAAAISVTLHIAPGNSSSQDDAITSLGVSLQSGRTYVGVGRGVQNPSQFAPNPNGRDISVGLTITDAGRIASTVPGEVQFIFSHSVTDLGLIDLVKGTGEILVNDAGYGDLSDYISQAPSQETFLLKDQSGTTLAAYDVDLIAYADSALTFFISGFLNPEQNQNGADLALLAALPSGNVIAFEPANMPPLVASPIADQTVEEDFATFTVVDLTTVFSDPDDANLSYNASTDGNTIAEVNGTNLLLFSVANVNGTSQVTVTASDNSSSAVDIFTVNITAVNDAPMLTALPNISFSEDASATLTLNSFVSDVDNDTSEIIFQAEVINASQLSGKPGLNGDDGIWIDPSDLTIIIDPQTNIATFTASMDSSGQFDVVFTATDTSNASDSDTIQVIVNSVNDAPTLIAAISDMTIFEDSGMQILIEDLNTVFGDADGDSLAFDAFAGAGLIANISGTALEVNSNADFFGMVSVTASADDGNASVSDTFTVTVLNINDPPLTFDLIAPADSFQIETPDPTIPVNFAWNAAFDADGDTLTYTFNLGNANRDTTISELAETSLVFDGSSFWQFGLFSWSVEVFDGIVSVASSDTFAIRFPQLVAIDDSQPGQLPSKFALHQNFPNPFNPSTNIGFAIPHGGRSDFPTGGLRSGFTSLKIYDASGRLVKTLIKENKAAGIYIVQWDATNDFGERVSSGLYFYQLKTDNFQQVRKMLLLQ